MNTRILAVVVGLTVSIIALGSILVPVIDDYGRSSDTYTNDGYFHMKKITASSPDISMFWDHTDPYNITVNGEKIALPHSYSYPLSLEATNNWGLRFLISGADVNLSVIGVGGINYGGASVASNTDLTIELSNGTASFDNGNSPYTASYTELYTISNDKGDYIMKKSSDYVYLNGDSPVYVTGRTNIGTSVNINLSGTIDDGFTAVVIAPANTYTASDYDVTKTTVSDHVDLYQFKGVDFVLTDGDSVTYDVSYSQVIVPYKVTAERTDPMPDAAANVLFAIPVIVLVGILLFAVTLIFRGRE